MAEVLMGIVSCSDSCHLGETDDTYGRTAAAQAAARGFDVVAYHVCPDDAECIEASLVEMSDVDEAHIVLTIGGTGLTLDQVTPEATLAAATRAVPGIAEAMRADVEHDDPTAMLTRATSVQRGRTLIINLPACEGPFEMCLEWVLARAADWAEAITGDGA